MNETAFEISFTLPLGELLATHRSNAERKAQEAFVLSLLKQGDISAGRASELLGVDRWQLSEMMSAHGISPFDERITREELEGEVTDAYRELAIEFVKAK